MYRARSPVGSEQVPTIALRWRLTSLSTPEPPSPLSPPLCQTTKAALKGKKILMYCTGGIRCERATALLDQMQKAEPSFKVEDITMVRKQEGNSRQRSRLPQS